MAVQSFFTLAFMSSLATQIILAALVIRWPLGLIIQNEWILTLLTCLGNAATGTITQHIIRHSAEFWMLLNDV